MGPEDRPDFLDGLAVFLDAVVGADDLLGDDAVEVRAAVGDHAVGRSGHAGRAGASR